MATIFLTGGSGFVGSHVLEELLGRGHHVKALVHESAIDRDNVTSVTGGVFDADLADAMAGCDAVIHLIGIIMEKGDATFEKMHVRATQRVVDATKSAGVPRYVHMSALGSRPDAVSDYHKTKWEAEQYVREHAPAGGLAWTIFRPSLIHGPGGEFTEQLAEWARGNAAPWLFMPYFGAGLLGLGGAGKLQPVHVDDVARVFVDAAERSDVAGKIYNLAGTEKLTWPEMHHVASDAITGTTKRAVPIPAWYAKALATITPAAWLPFNKAQVQMSQEDNTADITELCSDFGFQPRPFTKSFRGYASSL